MASGMLAEGHRLSVGPRAGRSVEQPLDVLGDHVHLEVHRGRPDARARRFVWSSVYGMSATVKALAAAARPRSARPRPRRPSPSRPGSARAPGGGSTASSAAVAQAAQLHDPPHAVHVALHDVAVEAAVRAQRPLQVDRARRAAGAAPKAVRASVSARQLAGEAVRASTSTAVRQQPLTAIGAAGRQPGRTSAAPAMRTTSTSPRRSAARDRRRPPRRCR